MLNASTCFKADSIDDILIPTADNSCVNILNLTKGSGCARQRERVEKEERRLLEE
jgi:hypothetical protein